MASKNQPARWEATLLAAVMAMAGAPFLFDKLGLLVRTRTVSFRGAFLHSAPVLLVAVGAILLLAEQDASTSAIRPVRTESKEDNMSCKDSGINSAVLSGGCAHCRRSVCCCSARWG